MPSLKLESDMHRNSLCQSDYDFHTSCDSRNNRRLGGALPGTLYLTRVDEFSNPMEFTEIPADLKCDIFSVEGVQLMAAVIDKDLIKISDDDQLNAEIPVNLTLT